MTGTYKPYLAVILIAALYVAFVAGAISMLVFNLQPPLVVHQDLTTSTLNITLYEGELSNGKMGFGYSADNLTSPGPTLRLTLSDVVNLTVINIGKMPHAFAVTEAPQTDAAILFKAEAGSTTNPIAPGTQASVVFAPDYAGSTFYYICPIAGHAEAGMWGAVIVTA